VIGVVELTQLVVFESTRDPSALLKYQLTGALLFFAVSLGCARTAHILDRRQRIQGTLSSDLGVRSMRTHFLANRHVRTNGETEIRVPVLQDADEEIHRLPHINL
jgi:hypothetical protein